MAEMEKAQSQSLLDELAQEFGACWRRLPDKGLFFGLLGVWLVLFHFLGNSTFGYVDTPSLLGWLWNAYSAVDGEDSFGKLIPLVVLGVLWWRREELLKLRTENWWPALVLLAAALTLHVVGYVVQQPRISTVAFFGGIYALTGLAWGRGWLKETFFPFYLFAFSVPVGSLAQAITFPLRVLVSKIAVWISANILGINAIRDGSQIFNASHTFQFDVAPACSGIHGLIALFSITSIYGFCAFQTPWKRLVLTFVSIPLAIADNVMRITTVIMVAEGFGQKAASKVETNFGFVTYAIALGCILGLGHLLRERTVATQEGAKPA